MRGAIRIPSPSYPAARASGKRGELQPTTAMLHWTLVFLVIALIAAVFGFTGVAGTAANIAKILFVIFLIIWIVSFVLR